MQTILCRLWMLVLLAGLSACQPLTDITPGNQPRELTPVLADIPPGVPPAQLQVREGDALTRSKLTLKQVLDTLARPLYLGDASTSRKPVSPVATPAESELKPEPAPPVPPAPPASEQATATKPNDLDNGATEMAEPSTAATPEFMHTYAAGRTAWRNGQFAEAINQLNSALRMSPNHPAVLALMGRIHLQSLNQPARGVTFLEQAVAGDPTDVESLFLLGRSAWEQGQWDLAIVILAEVIDRASEPIDPGLLVLARHLLGAALERQGYDAAAIPQFTANLKQQSPFGRTSTYQRELQMLQRQKPRIWQGVGDLYMRQGQLADALEAYQRARDTMEDQDRPALTARWVYVNLRLGDMKQVAGALLEYLRSSPDDANALQLLKYARQYDVPRELLVPGLKDIYQTTGQPESLALVLAESLDTDEGQELLQDHLQHDPTAWRVFAKLLTLAMEADEKRATPLLRSFEGNTGLRGALLTTARAIETTPRAASSYTQALLETVPAESVQQTAEKLRASGKAGAGMLYVLAQSAIRQKQWLAGEIALREALTMEPVIPAATLDLVRVLLAQKQWDAAGKVLAGITDETVEVTGLRVQWLSAQGQRDEALTLLDQALVKKPDDMELVVAKALLLLQIGQANKVLEAQRLLLSAVETAPTQERLYQILFVIYDRQAVPNAQQQRVALLRKALQHIPSARLTRIKLVEEHLRSNDLREAHRLLENLLQEKADEPAVVQLMLITLHRLGKPAEAEAMLNQYVQPETTDRRWLLLARGFYAGTGQQDKALMMVERLALLAPAGPQRDMQLAAIYLQTERAQKAADLLIKTVSNWPVQTQQPGKSANGAVADTPASPPPPVMPDGSVMDNGDENDLSQEVDEAVEAGLNGPGLDEALGLLARALIRLERGNEIDGWFEKAIGRHPQEEATLRLQWAMMLQRMGKTSLGEAQLHRVLKLKPDDGPALNALGYGWADQGIQLPQAKAMIEKALSQEPENPAYLDSMGWVEYKLGRFPQAVEWLTKARMRPGGDHPVILDHLGDALWRAGRKTEALRYWQVALDGITPDMVKDDPEVSRLQGLLPAKIAEATAEREPATAAVGANLAAPAAQP